ncbi:MAG: restriction endonuclease [Planctomycetaceae bacterium]|nr:restriction endonuclease [Planctomycetaceae bacterium]
MSETAVSVPDFQSMMLPFLQIISDGKERSRGYIVEAIADSLDLTEEQRNMRHPRSGENMLSNNMSWIEMNFIKANLISRPRRGSYQITKAGKEILRKKPKSISCRFLKDNCPSYAMWLKTRIKKEVDIESDAPPEIVKPPEELLKDTYSVLCSDLAQELLDTVKSAHWRFFERLVVDLLTRMGYGGSRQDAGQVVGKSGDNGIDCIINEDKLGLDVVYIQAKRFSEPVTISQVRDFAGALLAKKARKGVFITTSTFPKSAVEFVSQIEPKVILIDGQRLAQLMLEYNVGISVKETYEVKRIDFDYFDENEL